MTISPAVTLRNLVKRYGEATAIEGINLEITDGEFLVLLGPSGCGKTTTLRCIAGLEDVTSGEIRIKDEVVSRSGFSLPPEQREIGMVFQSYAIWPHMSVRENVAFGLRQKKLPRPDIEARVDEALDLVGLSHYADRGASQLSGGQQQRVALARAIVLRPRILLFDEPLSNLDAKLREKMRFELRQLQKRLQITAIYVTHDQQEAMVVADRVVLMNSGRIEQIASPRDIYDRPTSLFAAEFIGLTNVIEVDASAASSGGATVVASGDKLMSSNAAGAMGERVAALIRPELIRMTTTPSDGSNVYPARISDVVFLGNIADITLQMLGQSIRCQLSPPGNWTVGQQIWACLPPEHVILLPVPRGGPRRITTADIQGEEIR